MLQQPRLLKKEVQSFIVSNVDYFMIPNAVSIGVGLIDERAERCVKRVRWRFSLPPEIDIGLACSNSYSQRSKQWEHVITGIRLKQRCDTKAPEFSGNVLPLFFF